MALPRQRQWKHAHVVIGWNNDVSAKDLSCRLRGGTSTTIDLKLWLIPCFPRDYVPQIRPLRSVLLR